MDYFEKLKKDLLEQFRGKPNIEAFQAVLSRQLSDVYEFFYQLRTLRVLQTAEGKQLDGIGDIVVMSRAQALAISRLSGQEGVVMDDATYRLYLAFKIHLNTSNCTHTDVYGALKMFWDKPLYYSEDPAYPATMFFSTGTLTPDDDPSILFLAPKVKAAGVALNIRAVTLTPEMPTGVYTAAALPINVMTTTLPETEPGDFDTGFSLIAGALSLEITEFVTSPNLMHGAFLRDAATGAVSELYASDEDYGIDIAWMRT